MASPIDKRDHGRETLIEEAVGEHVTVPLAEETVAVSKTRVATGRVEVRTLTDTIEETLRTSLDRETVEVTRVPVDRQVDAAPPIRTEGDVTIVPVLEEILVVEKRLMLREEVHIRRLRTIDTIETPVTLRRQRAVVERRTAAGSSPEDIPGSDTSDPVPPRKEA